MANSVEREIDYFELLDDDDLKKAIEEENKFQAEANEDASGRPLFKDGFHLPEHEEDETPEQILDSLEKNMDERYGAQWNEEYRVKDISVNQTS